MSRSAEEIDVGLLRVVRELSRHGTVTAAAASLGKSQSTLSHALDRLRRHYGDPLFLSAGRQLTRTPLGARLVEEAERLLIDFDRLQGLSVTFDPERAHHRFRVHMLDLAELLILPGLVRTLGERPHGVEIEVLRLAGNAVWSELEAGRLDLVIGTPWKAHATLMRQQILDERYVGIARKGHPLRGQLDTLDGYLRCTHCTVAPRGPALGRIEAALEALSPARHVVMRVPDYLSIPSLVATTDAVAAVPSTLVDLHPLGRELLVFNLPVAQARFKVVQHWHRRAHEDPASRWLRRTVHGVVAQAMHSMQAAGSRRG
ncbi:MAG: LysR family transcriptional regulator [Burkholderiales bacterium]|nr:LysR family transcriptional regulator [Burkholderiales bacterium]